MNKLRPAGQTLGSVAIPCKELARETTVGGWKTLVSDEKVPLASYVKFTLTFTPVEDLPDGLAVPHTYYPSRKVGALTLYQDAHSVSRTHGAHAPRNCFEDMYNGILTAKKFIYVSGRIDPYTKLLRGQKRRWATIWRKSCSFAKLLSCV